MQVHRANQEENDRSVEQNLQMWIASHPNDPDALFTLGLIGKREGFYSEAERYYQQALRAAPQFTGAFSNLGNVYLARKEPETAIESYERAISIHPAEGAYYFNLHRAYAQLTFLSGKKDQAFQRARELDPKLVDYYLSLDTTNHPANMNRLVIDETLGASRLWERFLAELIGREGLLFRLFKAWFERIPSRVRFLVPVLFLVGLIGISRWTRTKRFLTRCPMCGVPTHRFYLGASEHEFICFNCYRIFVQREKLHPKIVEKKSLQVRHFQRQNHFIERFLSFFVVGLGYVWRGHYIKGLFLAFFFFIFVIRLIHWGGVVTQPEVSSPTGPGGLLVWGGLFTCFYLLSLWRVFRLKPTFSADARKG